MLVYTYIYGERIIIVQRQAALPQKPAFLSILNFHFFSRFQVPQTEVLAIATAIRSSPVIQNFILPCR